MEEIYFQIFESLPRQGPGDDLSTREALEKLSELPESPEILDVGCGTGAQTLVLAKHTGGSITALDSHAPFLDILKRNAFQSGVGRRVECIAGDMGAMDFGGKLFDLIWSEGAAYNIGFENALRSWRSLLKPSGYLVASELVWFGRIVPDEIRAYFVEGYPDMKHYDDVIPIIESAGYQLVDRFPLPSQSWWTDYYTPAEKALAAIRRAFQSRADLMEVVDAFQLEIDMFRQYSDFYGYAFYIMRPAR